MKKNHLRVTGVMTAAVLAVLGLVSGTYAGALTYAEAIYSEEEEIIPGEMVFAEMPALSAAVELPGDNEELLQDYIDSVLAGASAGASAGIYGLSGRSLTIFEILRERIKDVADGNTFSARFPLTVEELQVENVEYTAADLGVPALIVDNTVPEEVTLALFDKLGIDVNRIVSALSADAPYDLYWFDKVFSMQIEDMGVYISYDYERDDYIIYFESGMTFAFPVAEEYALYTTDDEITYEINPAVTGSIADAVADIQSVVSSYAGVHDYEKICGYRDAICSRTSYNFDAAENEGMPYGNPWQLIWVFDGDPLTNVVCEGYAKAFQYLCDLTSFSSGRIRSRLVAGVMDGGTGAGNHMWNVITMDDGKNYLVDVTNSDEDSVGDGGELFLSGTSEGDLDNGYWFICYGDNVGYLYDEETRSLYTDADLILAEEPYAWDGTDKPDFGTPDTVLPEDLTLIEEEAFAGDSSVVIVQLPEGLEEIGERAFAYCTGMRHIYIPESTVRIADDAFEGCTDLLIYGRSGSEAESYAAEKGFAFIEWTLKSDRRYKGMVRQMAVISSLLLAAVFYGAAPAAADEVVSFHTAVINHPKHATWYDENNRWRSTDFIYPEFIPETDAYPALNAALGEISSALETMRDEFLIRKKNGEEGYYYMDYRYPDIYREDSQLFSMLVYSSDPGSNYADTSRFYNIEPTTGRFIELSEVLATTDGLAEIIDSEVRKNDRYDNYHGDIEGIRASIADGTLRWGLGYDGLKVRWSYTGTNDGSYYFETTSDITILFSEHPELFTPTYQVLPGSYMIKMDPGRDYRFDLMDDGTMDTVRFNEVKGSYDDLISVDAVINGSTMSLPFGGEDMSWYFDSDPYYVHPANGASYFYVSLDGEDSALLMSCSKVDGNALTELDVFTHGLRVEFEGCGTYFTDYDPYVSRLSTYSARRYCRIGEGGWPIPVTDDYDISRTSQTLVLRRDMTFDVVDGSPEAQVTGSRTVPAGTKLNFWRSDLFTYVDLRIEEEDSFVRVYSEGGYPPVVNDMSAEDVFDGMVYAG